jgi:starvation-inducible DNA-binding protein
MTDLYQSADGPTPETAPILDERLSSLAEAALTLKQLGWNLTGHYATNLRRAIEREVDRIWAMIDAMAERIAALGGIPSDAPEHLIERHNHHEIAVGRATAGESLALLDTIFRGLADGHRCASDKIGESDPVSLALLRHQIHNFETSRRLIGASLRGDTGRPRRLTEEVLEAMRRQAGIL